MSDLQKLADWHEKEADRVTVLSARMSDGANKAHYREMSGNHTETAKILRLLAMVREGCYGIHTDELGHPLGASLLRIKGPTDLLRELAEVLRREDPCS